MDKYPLAYLNYSLKKTMQIIDKFGMQLAVVLHISKKVEGIVTDGDIRRALLNGISLDDPIEKIINKNFIHIEPNTQPELILDIFLKNKINHIIELDKERMLSKIHFTNEYLLSPNVLKKTDLNEGKKHVLVIGGAGYVGHHVIQLLLKNDFKVRCLDLELYKNSNSKTHSAYNENVEFIKGDMRSINVLIRAIKNIDAVIHLGAIVGDPASKNNPEAAITANYLSTILIAQTCKYFQINKFIFISTCSVYGQSVKISDETSPLNPVSLYGKNKQDSEKAIISIADSNFKPTILRFGTIFGVSERMRFDLVVNLLTANAVQNNSISIFGGNQWRPFLHVFDASQAILKVLESDLDLVGNQIYNVGSNENNLKIKELIPIFKKLFPKLNVLTHKSEIDSRDYKVNFAKIKKDLDFEISYTIEEGISEIKKYILTHGITHDNYLYNNAKYLEKFNDPIYETIN